MKLIEQSFYERDTVTVAQALLGTVLVRKIGNQILSGRIVETEAYCWADDPASHAYRGKTQRNAPMFGNVGCAYVYFIYGNYFCFNIVAKNKKRPAGAVLIRALQPIDGLGCMQIHRGKDMVNQLTNGPGKLTINGGVFMKLI